MKMIFDVDIPKNITDKYMVAYELRAVRHGELYLSANEAVKWHPENNSEQKYIILAHKQDPPLNLKFPASLMSIPCAGIVMCGNGIWSACKDHPGVPFHSGWNKGGYDLRLERGFFDDLPIIDESRWRESWIPKPKALCGGDPMKCPVSEGCAVSDGPCPITSFDPSKLGDKYEVVCGWPDTSKMRPPKHNELLWDEEYDGVLVCCIERNVPCIIIRRKWKWPEGFMPACRGIAWNRKGTASVFKCLPQLANLNGIDYWQTNGDFQDIDIDWLYPDLNLPNKDDWKNSYQSNPNHPANKKT